jgi:hypothetical protein
MKAKTVGTFILEADASYMMRLPMESISAMTVIAPE